MDKKLILLILSFSIIIPITAFAQEPPDLTNVQYDEKVAELNQKIDMLNQQVNQLITQNIEYRGKLNEKLDTLETKENSASSFLQLEQFIVNSLNSMKIILIIIVAISDVILVGYFLLLKSKGLL